jgi:hypothetical protein
MKFQFYFGPDKIPFRLDEKGMVEKNSTMPFHGIISKGIISEIVSEKMNSEMWHRYAPFIEQKSDKIDSGMFEFNSLINKYKILSFGQSAWAAQKYLKEKCLKDAINEDLDIEIWNIKEGHTSSVWKITVNNTTEKEDFVLNIARDLESSKELKETSEKLRAIIKSFSDINIAKVIDIACVKDELLPFEVTVTRNEWIDNSFEIHKRTNRETKKEELLLVERFLTDDKKPSRITSVVGRIFSNKEADKIKKDIDEFLTKAMTCLPEMPELTINEGDVVWDGEKAVIVAIS